MNIILTFDNDETSAFKTTFEQFVDENEMDEDEAREIMNALTTDGTYFGGGGAGVEYSVKVFQ